MCKVFIKEELASLLSFHFIFIQYSICTLVSCLLFYQFNTIQYNSNKNRYSLLYTSCYYSYPLGQGVTVDLISVLDIISISKLTCVYINKTHFVYSLNYANILLLLKQCPILIHLLQDIFIKFVYTTELNSALYC
jgi:uncharacterized membrane protein